MNNIKIASFNCKGVKRSLADINQLCEISDIIALQETWLLPHDIPFLSNINEEYSCTGTSAVDTAVGVLRGRPYGGVALLWKKSVFPSVFVVQCDNPRLCAIKIVIDHRAVLVFSVYMPTENVQNLPEFTDILSSVSAIINNENVEYVYILGDFNAHPNEQFYIELKCFCDELKWTCVDTQFLGLNSGTYTFVSEAHGTNRWLDHCVVTKSALSSIVNIYIMYDVFWSDHFPLIIECNLELIPPKINYNDKSVRNTVLWGNKNPEQIQLYTMLCHERLSNLELPDDSFCGNYICKNTNHKILIDNLYSDVINILSMAASESCSVKGAVERRPVVGWNRYVRDAHREARSAFLMWSWYGKPVEGHVYNKMKETRSIFKSRLKWCQNHSEQIKMDILASHHSKHDFNNFWKATNKINNGRPGLPVSVDGISEHSLIADLFRDHFTVTSPLGPSQQGHFSSTRCPGTEVRFTPDDVYKIINSMSRGKSPGHDGLSIEHLKHAGPHLSRVLATLYNLCIKHAYLPEALMKTVVVPIVKNKTGNISDKSNYRPISLATVAAKVLDGLLDTQLDKYLNLHDNQFGFRPGLSTESAILCLKQTVRYYTERSTPVFACFLDLSKAFDLVNYDILWKKLQHTGIPLEISNLFKFWYLNQVNVVRWSESLSKPYRLECGVRQGGLTSPKLFNLYINALIEELSSTHVGCYIDGICFNNISYADDMVLLSASVSGLNKLLKICENYASLNGLTYNVKKSEFMVFPASNKPLSYAVPPVKLYGTPLKRVEQFKYLGHVVCSDLTDNADMERERRALSVRANMLVRRFARCSIDVKVTLFRAYCTSFYTSNLWVDYTQKQFNALRVQYNNAFRLLMGLPRYCSASGMFAEARVDCFYTTLRKRCTSLLRRIRASPSSTLKTFSDRCDCRYLNHCGMVHVLANRSCLK
ncbi:uncharacterized protein LOC124542674 [Vanessa cardui]|uniref:uncharacterized protein LOC124542674 n=1 Tax=Vanessa cardui TaxID=171605 RepID=UPI001F13F968|nr:uncharacterized protein LOC124542674 [Vanessa cardui]